MTIYAHNEGTVGVASKLRFQAYAASVSGVRVCECVRMRACAASEGLQKRC